MARTQSRRRRSRLRKPDQVAKARWYAARGYPFEFIAQKTGTHRNSVRRWCASNDNRSLNQLAIRLRQLTPAEFSEVMGRIGRRRRVA